MYERVANDAALSQGDLIEGCPFTDIRVWPSPEGQDIAHESWIKRAVILTQACDLTQAKTSRVVVAPVHEAAALVSQGILKAATIRDQIRRFQVFGWYFLPAAPAPISLPESIIDLRELHTIDRGILEHQAKSGKRLCRLETPWREHLAQHFGVTYMRIALPEPYPTEP